MIKIENTGTVVKLEETESGCLNVILNKPIKLKTKDAFFIKTKLNITCDSPNDICWVFGTIIHGLVGTMSNMINQDTNTDNLEIVGGYMGEDPLTLPKGEVIAQIYKTIDINNDITQQLLSADEAGYNQIFKEEGLLVKTCNKYDRPYELIVEPDGTKYVKFYL